MIRETFPVGLLGCNCTVLGDELSKDAVIVDPGAEITRILSVVARYGLTVRSIVVTHAHIDHIAGALELKRLTGAPILYSEHDLPLVAIMDQQADWLGVATPEVAAPDGSLADGDVVEAGAIHANVLHTPGHTPGSLCLYLPSEALLLAGDTLFAGSVGRTDLPGGDERQLLRSIHGKLLTLPEATLVIPGHGEFTRIGRERESNPFLQAL